MHDKSFENQGYQQQNESMFKHLQENNNVSQCLNHKINIYLSRGRRLKDFLS